MEKRALLILIFFILLFLGIWGVLLVSQPSPATAGTEECADACNERGYDDGGCHRCSPDEISIGRDPWCQDTHDPRYLCCCRCPDPPCNEWQNESCGGNDCGPLEMYQTRSCQPGCGDEESRCVEDLANCCQCDAWKNEGCGLNGCRLAEMYQTRECLLDCDNESRCLEDLENCCRCSDWQDQECGQGSCSILQMYQTRTCDPSGCLEESCCIGDESCGNIPPSFKCYQRL